MAAGGLMALLGDGSVEVRCAGGARLVLSPCGSEYLYEEALPAAAHPLQPAETCRRRVAFVLSAHREQVARALNFRNKFSSRPFLPSRLISPERKTILFSDILEVRWPDPVTADLTRCIKNGNVKISSLDGYAHLYLSELQQEFTVEFLCKVSQPSAAYSHSSQKNSNYQNEDQYGKSSKNSLPEMLSKQTRVENRKNEHGSAEGKYREPTKPKDQKDRDRVRMFCTNCSYEYAWVTQCWSVSSYPEEWKYPLSLALMCYNLHTVKTEMKRCEGNNHTSIGADVLIDPKACEAVSRLPAALPLSCRAPHLHRFIHGKRNIAEIYPGDESFFKSEGAFLGNYFVHYVIQKGTNKREEKMYSVNSLPPDVPGSPYSISSIITQATKILQYCYKTKLSLIHNYHLCCWKMVPETDGREMLPVLLDEKVIPSIGRLLVYSDYKVHATFRDGITLNMVWDFSSGCRKIQVNENVGWCKLTTPDGVQQLIKISHPGIYERYIATVIEWCRSLNESKEIPGYTAHSVTEENWSADAELEKIRRFNYLLDNSNVPERTSAAKTNPSTIAVGKTENRSDTEELNEGCILKALEKTSKIIQDIESLLAASGK
uniref:Chromosome 5 open reading frame 34 n=1 Tax=Anser brachyrhynchus TaxID=132585 RepID=A0A8B9C183_9AVES